MSVAACSAAKLRGFVLGVCVLGCRAAGRGTFVLFCLTGPVGSDLCGLGFAASLDGLVCNGLRGGVGGGVGRERGSRGRSVCGIGVVSSHIV